MTDIKPGLESAVNSALELYGIETPAKIIKIYKDYNGEYGEDHIKVILSALTKEGKQLVIKILRTQDNIQKERDTIEKQSEFSEFMRKNGIKTPKIYMASERYCNELHYNGYLCNVTVEDYCGEEILEINTDIAYMIGELVARMHNLSLENKCKIGCNTLFSAAYENDVDAFGDFCEICKSEKLNHDTVEEIKRLRQEKLDLIRSVWDRLPKAAVQGDISINNLVYGKEELTVFDYNNAGDEVLISDLCLEGLLTAYEMDLPKGIDESYRKKLFPAFLNGYLSIRKLSEDEANAAFAIYTLYNSLWFTKIIYNEDSLDKLTQRGDFDSANELLDRILSELTEKDDGRFKK